METLNRKAFLIKACRWCAGMGGLYLAGNLISCSERNESAGVESQQTTTTDDLGSSAPVVVITEKCIGCGKCTRGVCPEDAIQLEGNQAVINADCKGCGRCIDMCPKGAIQYVELTRSGSGIERVGIEHG